jgi:hypothetical protein
MEIEQQDAKDAGALGFMARAVVQATLPHSDPHSPFFQRKNGNYTLTLSATSPDVGLPYGTIPRLLLAWISTEAVRTQSRTLTLGDSLSAFMRDLDLVPTGGRWGTITRLREQTQRLFSCSILCSYSDGHRDAGKRIDIASAWDFWWDPQRPEQAGLWQSTVTLGEAFFAELLAHPVPIDLRALRALRRSPLALDVYVWLVYRLSYLRAPTVIPWASLALQFGADYARADNFKAAITEALGKVGAVYPAAKVQPTPAGLLLSPSPLHIPR